MALFSWINSNIITLNRVQDANAQSAATANVLDYMNAVNPMTTPEGEANLGSYRFKWKASPVTDVRDGAGYPFGVSFYQLALYKTDITLTKPDASPWFSFALQQVGYKRVRGAVAPV